MCSTTEGTKPVTTYCSEVNRLGRLSFAFVLELNVLSACGNCLDGFCQVGADLYHTECGRDNQKGAFGAGNTETPILTHICHS